MTVQELFEAQKSLDLIGEKSNFHSHFIFNSFSVLQKHILFNQSEEALATLAAISSYLRIVFQYQNHNTYDLDATLQLSKYITILLEYRLEISLPFTISVDDLDQNLSFHKQHFDILLEYSIMNLKTHGIQEVEVKTYESFLVYTISTQEPIERNEIQKIILKCTMLETTVNSQLVPFSPTLIQLDEFHIQFSIPAITD